MMKTFSPEFTDGLYKIYPSKRPASCVIYITYPSFTLENSHLAGRPYFPCNFIGGRLPMLNSIKTFNTEVCQICNENPACILFCVCGHICVCGECIKKNMNLPPVQFVKHIMNTSEK